MKNYLLLLNHSYLFFGATLYVGVLWALRFFWYPSWQSIDVGNAQAHFIGPTSAATKFFTIVVPLMFLTNIVMIWCERKHKKPLILAVVAFACILTATWVGTQLIIPVNEIIAQDNSTQAELSVLLGKWMNYNDYRFMLLTTMWLSLMAYFITKGNLTETISD